MMGFENALGEVTLVLFTTLAPSGAVAIMALACVLLFSRMDEATRARVNKCLCIPLVFTMVGLVASATHLGNPSNALYVLSRVGASPLSNEVFAAVLFLGCVGLYWLYSFVLRPIRAFQRVLLALQIVLGAAFVAMISLAYSVDTIPTWSMPSAPALIWLNAFTGGPLVLSVTLYCARWEPLFGKFGILAWAMSLMALVASTVAYALQWTALREMGNSIVDVDQLVPCYVGMVVSFALLCGIGLAFTGATLRKAKKARESMDAGIAIASSAEVASESASAAELPRIEGEATSIRLDAVTAKLAFGCAFVFAGIFIMRFAFYMAHMTVGLTV